MKLHARDYRIFNEDNLLIAECSYADRASQIVKAVNCHDELVEALKRALDCENKNGILSIPCIEQMKQAIEKATQ